MPTSFTIVECAVYSIPDGILFIPNNSDYVLIAKKYEQSKYHGHFLIDHTFLAFVCKEEVYNSSLYIGAPEYQGYYILSTK